MGAQMGAKPVGCWKGLEQGLNAEDVKAKPGDVKLRSTG
jgi:hypothetical protein